MSARFPENLLTVRWQVERSSVLLERARERAAAAASRPTPHNVSARTLAAIEHHLAAGHEAYHRGRYLAALQAYRRAQVLIYQLLDPGVPAGTADVRAMAVPLGDELLRPVASVALELIDAVDPATTEASFVASARLPAASLAAMAAHRDRGVRIADSGVREARNEAELAAQYAGRCQWRQARNQLARARASVGGSAMEAVEARAALDLDEAAIAIQQGDLDPAAALLERSRTGFTQVRDAAGLTQVELNLAALATRRGDAQGATAALARAARMLQRAEGAASPIGAPADQGRTTVAGQPSALAGLGPGAIDLDSLRAVADARGQSVTYRLPGRAGGWAWQRLEAPAEAEQRRFTKSLGLLLGGEVVTILWPSGGTPPVDELLGKFLARHAQARELHHLIGPATSHTETAAQLPYLYFYVLPVALGDCHHELGQFEAAEHFYLQAANYRFLNVAIEAPALWMKLAGNALAWGDSLYETDEFARALGVYRKVVEPREAPTLVPLAAPLYAHPALRAVGQTVLALLQRSDGIGDANPELAAVVLEIRARLLQLGAGLDFLGMPADLVPIWSFEYLQGVARYLAQQAIQAEREFVRFLDRAEAEEMTALQLKQAVDVAKAEVQLAKDQTAAAAAEQTVYDVAVLAALARVDNAKRDRAEYEDMMEARIDYDSRIGQYAGGDEIVPILQQWRDQNTLEYELAARDRQISELQNTAVLADLQNKAAQARVEVARQMEAIAALKSQGAGEQLAAFDAEFFTPDVWKKMASFIRRVSKRYLDMATRAARMMQRAYNFAYDVDRQVIRASYSNVAVKGLLGADLLLLDIDAFTHDLLDTVRRKEIPVKQSVSLATRFPYPFQTQFRQTGALQLETRLADFELAHPGLYGSRLERVEVHVEGLLPSTGLHGTLTNSGLSQYRTAAGQVKFRVHARETMALSEYRMREDAYVFPADPARLGIFEGAGVASAWTLDIPVATNDVDMRTITDVRLVFFYRARYDEGLAALVRQELASTPGALARMRTIHTRWVVPDAFFHFKQTGDLEFSVDERDFPANQLDPVIRHVAVVVAVEDGVDPAGWQVRLSVPGHPDPATATLDSHGAASAGANHPWQPLSSGTATGPYAIALRAVDNPSLVVDGKLDLAPIRDVILLLEYQYTPRA